jgi:hypothetical protein
MWVLLDATDRMDERIRATAYELRRLDWLTK